jgi:hypothetical protein
MNALVKKEIRLLLPGFAAACVLALTNLCAPSHADGIKSLWQLLPFVICPLCVITMALGSFGAAPLRCCSRNRFRVRKPGM